MSNPKSDFEKFKSLLEKNQDLPGIYVHKIVGANTKVFSAGLSDFEKKFVGLTRVSEKQSASGKHLSVTYEFQAGSAEDIIQLVQATQSINDLIYIL